MKRVALLSFLLFICLIKAQAQEGYTHLNLSAGLMYKETATGSVALEFGKKYNSYVELFADAYKSRVDQSENYLAGLAYKPNILRVKNIYLNFRLGAGIDTDTDQVIGGFQLGFEGGVILPKNFTLMLH